MQRTLVRGSKGKTVGKLQARLRLFRGVRTLVLAHDEQQDGAWRLVAIIHDRWTP